MEIAIAQIQAGITWIVLSHKNYNDDDAAALAAALRNNATLTSLCLSGNNIGAEGAQSLAAALDNNATLTRLDLGDNNIGAEGARALAAALRNNATLTSLGLFKNNIGAEGARALAVVLDTNRTLQHIYLYDVDVDEVIENLVEDRLELNEIIAHRFEIWINKSRLQVHDLMNLTNIQIYIAAEIVFLANGDELLNRTRWKSTNGRQFASRFLQMVFANQIHRLIFNR